MGIAAGKSTKFPRERSRLLNLEESYCYKIIYSRFFGRPGNARISLILLVGAGRFERPTPCAQGRCATRLRYAPTTYVLNLSAFPHGRRKKVAQKGRPKGSHGHAGTSLSRRQTDRLDATSRSFRGRSSENESAVPDCSTTPDGELCSERICLG